MEEPKFGTISLKNRTTENVTVLQDEKKATLTSDEDFNFSVASGQRRFRFYLADILQKDTILTVEPFASHNYVLFKPNTRVDLQIYDSSLNGFSTLALPDSGKVKLSFANFSSSLPGKVNVYLTTKTYIGNVQKDIQIGEFLQVQNTFSEFKTILIGTGAGSKPQTLYSITIKDPVDHNIIGVATISFPNSAVTGALLSSVYLLYLDANNNINILMSK